MILGLLPAAGKSVWVGPPLLARAAASCGLTFRTPLPLVVAPF